MTRSGWAAAFVLLAAAAARGDGIVVPSRAAARPVRTPDQRALVAFDGAEETIVVETTLAGDGRDFAWIVPLPAAPKVEESTPGLFPTLEAMTGPLVETRDEHVWLFVLVAGLVVVATARWGGRRMPWAVAGLFGYVGLGALAAALVVRLPRMQATEAGGDAGAARVISRESVGAFDTAVLAVPDAAALRAWLDANGFRAPDALDAVAADYVAKGWVFVASKIRRDAAGDEVRAVRPLSFTFPTTTCVYPMRLTGVGAESLELELFVFGPSRAKAAGLDVEYCRAIRDPWMRGDGACHAELVKRVSKATASADYLHDVAVTKLVGALDRRAMRDDLELRWTKTRKQQDVFLTAGVALSRAAAFGVGAFCLTLVVCEISRRRRGQAAGARDLLRATGLGVLVGCTAWAALPRLPSNAWEIPGRDGRDTWAFLEAAHEPLAGVASARAWVASHVAGAVNGFTRGPVVEEDSPGNYVVRDVDGKVELILHGADSRWALATQRVLNVTTGRPNDTSNLRSERTFALEGIVRGDDGSPVPGARVFVEGADPDRVGRSGDFMANGRQTTTDDAGRFRVTGLADEKWDVGVHARSRAMLLVEDVDPRKLDGRPLELRLPVGVSLAGRVVDAQGRAVPRAEVVVQPRRPFFSPENRYAIADGDGVFEMTGLSAETGELEVTVHVRRADGTTVWTKTRATAGAPPATLVVETPR